ncbi:efflux RND transporter periplasmic adaptor subunit [Pedobacter ureilyticus]|uniref:Efflux RND transporter periplasmic adaptor subunit n=1 Tax=Pedobacter ureilyticus TaxID=1393051 RepID=A0ABW9J1C3_9SPHI|nr:efflux RND transporter periplasmic adaptor subunit [Pedobacter helvus]
MKRIKHSVIILFILNLIVGIVGCSEEKKTEDKAAEKTQQTFTCPMHPQVIKHEMGTCPICAMDLVPFEKNSDDKSIKLDAQRQLLANIKTIRIGDGADSKGISNQSVLNGRLVLDPQQSNYISAKIAGRVEELFVRETGVAISKGQPLYKIYSEQLATLQQEYLMALAQQKQFAGDKLEQQLVSSAKQKLLLYGQTEAQLQKLSKTQQKNPYVTVFATQSGTVAELSITQGQYVAEGSPIMRLEGYGKLWVEADVYPNEMKQIKQGVELKVVVNGWEDQVQTMKVDFINPSLQAGTQLTQIRGSIANPNNQWQPGLQVKVMLASQGLTGGMNLPVDAVIRDGKGQHVWIKTGKDSFEPMKVSVGKANGNSINIASGIATGDEVVVTGAYLLYSEYVLKRGKHPLG